MTIRNKIITAGAIVFLVFAVLAWVDIKTHRMVTSHLSARDEADKKLDDIRTFVTWKIGVIRSVADIIASGHVPRFALDGFSPASGAWSAEYGELASTGRKLVGLIAEKEKETADMDREFARVRSRVNELYGQLDDKIASVMAKTQMDRVLGEDDSEKSALAPYVLKSLNQLTLVAMNGLLAVALSDEDKSVVAKNKRFLASQLPLIDPEGSIKELFAALFDQIDMLERLIARSDQTLAGFERDIAKAKEGFDLAVKHTGMDHLAGELQSDLDLANEKLKKASHRSLIVVIIFLFILPLLVVAAGVFGLNYLILRPIDHLMAAMKHVEDGRFDVHVPVKAKDEIGKLARAFNIMAAEIRNKVADMPHLNRVLSESESKYKTLVDNLPQRVFFKNKQLVYVSCNRFFVDGMGIHEDEIPGKTDFDLVPAEFAEKFRADDARILSGNQPEEIEETIFVNGKHIVVNTIKTPVRDDNGEVTGVLGISWDITRRKEMEDALRLTQFIFDKADISIFILDENGSFTNVNEKACSHIGYSREELLTMAVYDLDTNFTPDVWGVHMKELRRQGTKTIETMNRHKNGTVFPVQVIDNIMIFEGREYHVAFVQDISERKAAQIALQESEARLSEAQKLAGLGYWDWDVGKGEVLWSEEVFRIFGLDPLEFSPQIDSIMKLSPWPEYNKRHEEIMQQFLETKEKGSYDQKFLRPDGSIGYYHSTYHGEFNDRGELVSMKGTVIDISERKNRESELQRLRNYLSNVINSMPSMLVGVDAQGTITQWNREAEKVTDLSADKVLGIPLDRAIPRLATEMERVRVAIRTREKQAESINSRKENGDPVYEDLTIYPLIANGVEGAVIRIDNVTEKVWLEEMMIQSEKMMSVGGLAAGMAHEINNPLAGMMQTAGVMAGRLGGNLDIPASRTAAREAGTTVEAVARFMELRGIPRMLETINKSGRRVAEIVENMLSFARKSDAAVSPHDLGKLLDKTLELAVTDYDLKKKYDFKRIAVKKEYADPPVSVSCEGSKIQQVLLNILRNGAEAMSDTASPRFILRTRQEGDTAVMEIEDNGPGMDEQTRKRIFEPFFTTKPVGAGTGLGLSVSYFIITENHRGEMDVKSTPGAGATFRVCLPMKGKSVE